MREDDGSNRRESILKNKQLSSTYQKNAQTTALGHSVTFKELNNNHDVREFCQTSPRKIEQPQKQRKPLRYTQMTMVKDINFINTLYHQILVSLCKDGYKGGSPQNDKIVQSIRRVISENIPLKEQLNKQYSKILNLNQLASYLGLPPQDLISGNKLHNFIEEYTQKENDLKWLQIKCKGQLESKIDKKKMRLTDKQSRSKEKRLKYLKTQIDRQQGKVKMLYKQQKQLLKKLYRTQEENSRKERTTSILKMKVNQVESRKSYQKLKIKGKEPSSIAQNDKENYSLIVQKQPKSQKISSFQKIKSKKSLGRFFRQ